MTTHSNRGWPLRSNLLFHVHAKLLTTSFWIVPVWPTIRELPGRLHFLSVGRYKVKVGRC